MMWALIRGLLGRFASNASAVEVPTYGEVTVSDTLLYAVTVSDTRLYGVTVSDTQLYGVTISDGLAAEMD